MMVSCETAAPDCMRNADKSRKIPNAVAREVENDLESISETGSPPKVYQFFQSVEPIITPTFNEIGRLHLQQSCSQTE